MKKRPKGFLSNENIPHDSQPFLYIRELHDYLWDFIHVAIPGAQGDINDYIDIALELLRNKSS